jgi:hypothetical protein
MTTDSKTPSRPVRTREAEHLPKDEDLHERTRLTPSGASSAYSTRLASIQSAPATPATFARREGSFAKRHPATVTRPRARMFHTTYAIGTPSRSTPNARTTKGDVNASPVAGEPSKRHARPPTVATPSQSVTVVNATPSATSAAESPQVVQNR